MSATLLLSDALVAVREEGDLEDLTDRHSDAELIRFWNRSWARLRSKLAGLGFPLDMTRTAPATLPTAPPLVGEQYLEVDFPQAAVFVYGLDVLVGGKWIPLKPGTFAERRDYVSLPSVSSLGPSTYVIVSVDQESTTTTTRGKIQLYPLSAGGQSYVVWHMPAWVDVTNPAHVFYGHDGSWFDWAINDTIIRTAKKDDDSQNTYAIANRERDLAWEEIKRTAANLNRAEPIRPVRRSRRR